MSLLYYPGFTALGGIGTVGVGGFGESCLVLDVALTVAFTHNEHTPWLQAPSKLSDSLRVI